MGTGLQRLLLILQLVVVFALGIAGNKLAELTSLDVTTLIMVTVALLIVASGTQLLGENRNRQKALNGISSTRKVSSGRKPLLSNNMLSMISIGMLFGLLTGVATSLQFATDTDFLAFGYPLPFGVVVFTEDLLATAIGVLAIAVVSIFIEPYLAAGISIGFGLGIPPAFLLTSPKPHFALYTIVGFFLIFLALAITIVRCRASLKRLRELLVSQRT